MMATDWESHFDITIGPDTVLRTWSFNLGPVAVDVVRDVRVFFARYWSHRRLSQDGLIRIGRIYNVYTDDTALGVVLGPVKVRVLSALMHEQERRRVRANVDSLRTRYTPKQDRA